MIVTISKKLSDIYIANHKNYNYALGFLLNSLDLEVCSDAFKIVETFELGGDRIEIKVDDSNAKQIQSMFGSTENSLIEQLLWVSILFPEI